MGSIVIGLAGSAALYWSLLYYRANEHFVFFNRITATQGGVKPKLDFFSLTQTGDLIFGIDFVIILLVFLLVLIFGKTPEKVSHPNVVIDLGDFQKSLLSFRDGLRRAKMKLTAQQTLLNQTKAENDRLRQENDELLRQVSSSQTALDTTQTQAQEKIEFLKAEKNSLLEGIESWTKRKNQLYQARAAMEEELKKAQNHLALSTQGMQQLVEERLNFEQSIKNFEKNKFDETVKLEKMQQIAEQTRDEMLTLSKENAATLLSKAKEEAQKILVDAKTKQQQIISENEQNKESLHVQIEQCLEELKHYFKQLSDLTNSSN